MATLYESGIDVEGNDELAQVINASMHALTASYRAGSPYSSAPEGLISTRYSGHAFWDVETWQWPTFLAFWPDQARNLLDYRVDLAPQAAANAALRPSPFLPFYPKNGSEAAARPSLAGMRFPWESALAGIEQCSGNGEDHVMGDIATAFRQYWHATRDADWLRRAGWPVIKGIATFYASRATSIRRPDGGVSWHIARTMGE